ncbi:hypothetical protein N7478_009693 [Penicillium angulare]|uniref:uncharacterized protein n=1 Tax=Penicillium angulare TaxID=116970 RepID=UPI0025412730|nr:uncharacterized protein N7478_009693 [Penicillium angulare]KAJ5266885.1 hypothetical protein N7478_009693 [Penicillium angulare]
MCLSSIQKVIILGATGHVGPHLVSIFDADPHFEVSILSRASSDCSQFPPHIPVYRVSKNYDTSDSELVEILRGQDAVVSAITEQAIPQQKVVIDAAIKAGVKFFVPSEFGHDTMNEQAARLLPPCYVTQKRQIVEYLQTKEVDGLKWTAFVTGPFFEIAVPHFLLGSDFQSRRATIFEDYGDHPWSTTTLDTTAMAVKNALLDPTKSANKYLLIESFNVSQNSLLSVLERLTGKKWDVSLQDSEEEKILAVEKLARGNFSAIPTLMRYVTCVEGYGGDYMRYGQKANSFLSLAEESLESSLEKILE